MFSKSDREYAQQLWNIAKRARQELDLATAVACYQKLLCLQPENSDVYLQLGNVLNQQQQTDRAISAYQKAIALKPEQPVWVYQTLGKACQQQQRYAESIQAYQQALNRAAPAETWVYRHLGTVLTKQQQYDRAIAIYQDLIDLEPFSASEIYIKIGDIYQQQNKFFAAKAAYRKASWTRALFNINEVIACIRQYFASDKNLLDIDILDNGCDPTGRQLALLAERTQGRVVGTNVAPGFPQHTVKRRRVNNQFYRMDGQNLTFDDESFDLVMSLNVLEHVPNPARYLQECCRVLRPGGVGFFSWYPVWSGATGHHVHPDMVSRKAQQLSMVCPEYSLDGSSIPLWGHLLFDPSEMLSWLIEEQKYYPALAKWMRDYIYHGNDLNRWFWRDVWRCFQIIAWDVIDVEHRGQHSLATKTSNQLQQKYGQIEDFGICGAKIIVRK